LQALDYYRGFFMSLNTHTMTAPTYIYESPDGGETVYRRLGGSPNRELIKVAESQRYIHWREIQKAAETDEYLADLLDRAEAYYRLKYHAEI